MPLPRNPRPHFLLPDSVTTTSLYRAPNSGGRNVLVPAQPRGIHAQLLRADLAAVALAFVDIKPQQQEAGWASGFGLTVRFASFPDVRLAIDTLEQKNAGIELLSVREEGEQTIASVWIPEGKLAVFERKIADYVSEKTDKNGKPRDNQRFIDAIRDIRAAVIDDLWVDESALPPDSQIARFEAWISTSSLSAAGRRSPALVSTDVRIERFRHMAALADLQVGEKVLRFPERAVLQVRGTVAQLRNSVHILGQLAELRRAPETPDFFMHLAPNEQQEWTGELLQRTQIQPPGDHVPYVCVLDTGCTQGHPLLAYALHPDDMHTVDPAWGTDDQNGHGTEQSGLALWGDLTGPLEHQGAVVISHRLESVKLLPRDHANLNEHFGPLTAQAVSLPEIGAPFRRRVFSMAITSTETTLRGRPTAWSAEVDALASDWAGSGEAPRLMVLSAGNVIGQRSGQYPAVNSLTSIEDPAQAWNALSARVKIT